MEVFLTGVIGLLICVLVAYRVERKKAQELRHREEDAWHRMVTEEGMQAAMDFASLRRSLEATHALELSKLKRQLSSTKGQITKLKKQAALLKGAK